MLKRMNETEFLCSREETLMKSYLHFLPQKYPFPDLSVGAPENHTHTQPNGCVWVWFTTSDDR